MDLLKKEEKNFVEPLVGLNKIGKGVGRCWNKGGGIKRLK
jgi:hypothetical protein